MSEDRLDALIRELARSYHEPPEPPRELMWARISARRRGSGRAPHWRWVAGIAAALVLGIGLGRATLPRDPATPVAETAATSAPREASLPIRLAATHHLGRTEAFLTSYRADRRAGRQDDELAAWARELLADTWLLLDSPAADDPAIRLLLEEIELILAQIARLPAATPDESELIDQALREHGTLSRIRAVVSAGHIPAGT